MGEMNVHELKFWIGKVINDPELIAKNGITYCNIFVQRVCRGLGYDKFDGMTANQIYDFCAANWVQSSVAEALDGAILGDIVLAACKGNPHGHVVIIWPEKPLVYSGKWKMEVPRVANVGRHNGIMGANYAFIDRPDFFRLMKVTE